MSTPREYGKIHAGSGTLIGRECGNPEIRSASVGDIPIIAELLEANMKKGFLKPRSFVYVTENHARFRIASVDGIPVGCVEIIPIDDTTVELGALSVIDHFTSFRIGHSLIRCVEEHAESESKTLISVTDNPKLESIYLRSGYKKDLEGRYLERGLKSPGKTVFIKDFSPEVN